MNVIENNAASLMRNVYVHQTIISRQIKTSLEPKGDRTFTANKGPIKKS